ncbi:HupE/UreJ family protein [Ferruginibacter sp. SUN002]|uniref:HupE/UreJ family protein n=1 Tax=Ferruginibacter sp. SUN002 TaxID=2937789 RepID=UPI003D3652D0
MIPFIASNNKLTYGVKALGLLVLSIFLTQFLWSNVSFTELTQISKPSTSFAFIQLGAASFTNLAMGHLMFVLSLFLFGSKHEFVMKQLVVFTLTHMLTLWLGAFNVIPFSPYIAQALALLSTVYIAGENIFAFKLKSLRVTAVAICGLVHGFAMSSHLHEAGVTEGAFGKSLLMYNLGMELAIACFAVPAFLIFVKLAAGKHYSKAFFNIASGALVLLASYYTVNQLLITN